MSNTVMEKIIVEKVTQYGVRANGVNYGISPRLKEKGIEPNSFNVGSQYEIELYIGPKGGRSINSFSLISGTAVDMRLLVPAVPAVPSLPTTATHETVAPKGVAPVTPAQRRPEGSSDDKMTKADWADRNRTIELQAIMKSTLESPMLAQLAVGKRFEETLQNVHALFEFALNLYDSKK